MQEEANSDLCCPLNATFLDWDSVRSFVLDQGFDYWKGIPIKMGDGYEHIFVYEYPHKDNCFNSPSRFCRAADLRWECRKPKPGEPEKTVPDLIGFIQVSLGRRNK